MVAANVETPSAIAILGRVLADAKTPMSLAAARYFVKATFSPSDQARMADLLKRNRLGTLRPYEREELLQFSDADCLLGILKSRARLRLKIAKNKSRSTHA